MTQEKDSWLLPWVENLEEEEIFLNNPMHASINSTYDEFRIPNYHWRFNLEDVEDSEINNFVSLPLEDMPLYINDEQLWKRLFSWFRLMIGR